MLIFIILASVVLVAFLVVGFLFYILRKESSLEKERAAVKLSSLSEFKMPDIPVTPMMPSVDVIREQEAARIAEEYAKKEEDYQRRVTHLEGELQNISQKAQHQSQEALSTIDELRKENEQLKGERSNRVTSAEANLIKTQETVDTMKEEQLILQGRLDDSQTQVHKMQEEIVFIKHQMAQEISQNKVHADELMAENQTLHRSVEVVAAETAKNFQEEINTLKGEIGALNQEHHRLKAASHDLAEANQKLTETNATLTEQSETLQWELTKARAQMTSFERACENYQRQLKEALDKGGSVEDNFSKANENNTQLQAAMDELQRLNEELSKREKLYEFELEKSRNQIASLEKEYQQLKASVQQGQ